MPSNQEWLTTGEIADRLQTSENTVRDRIRKINVNKNLLKRKKVNRSFAYNEKSVGVLFEASSMYDNNFTHKEVLKALEEKYLSGGEVEKEKLELPALSPPQGTDPYIRQIGELTSVFVGFVSQYKRANDLMERRLDLIDEKIGLDLPEAKPVKKVAAKKKVSPARKRGVAKKKVATMKGAVPKKKRSWKFWRK